MEKAIGIVGGMGPYAGLDLNKKIFDNIKTNGNDQDYLNVYLLSRSSDIPDRTLFLEKKAKNPANGIFRCISKLEKIGSTVIGIPCNTAHSPLIFDEVKKLMKDANCKSKLLSIVEETYIFLENCYPNLKKIGLIGTMGTFKTNLYKNYFEKKGKFEIIEPDTSGKENCHDAIYNLSYGIKAFSNPVGKEAKNLLSKEIQFLIKKGAQVIILGCTEIPLAFCGEKEYDNIPLIDPTNILARALIKSINPECLKD